MHFPKAGFVFATTTLIAGSAFAAAGTVTADVVPLTSPVTYSTSSLQTYVGYQLNFTNSGGNTINDLRFTFTASATDTAEVVALFDPATYLPAGCTQTGVSSFTCTRQQLSSGQSFFSQPIVVFFRAPVKVVNGAADELGQDSVHVGGELVYAEGTSGKNPKPNSAVAWTGPSVSLGTTDPINVRSALPQSGGTLFTGDRAITNPEDQFSVSVTVPSAPTFAKRAELFESDVTLNSNCTTFGNFHKCFAVQVSILDINEQEIAFAPSSGSFMSFLIRVDALNIKTGTKISDARIQYYDGVNNHNVVACVTPTTPRSDGIPCIAKAVFYKNKSVQGWTADLNGDFEWWLINLKNGSFTLF